jgi:hypothetical protein
MYELALGRSEEKPGREVFLRAFARAIRPTDRLADAVEASVVLLALFYFTLLSLVEGG